VIGKLWFLGLMLKTVLNFGSYWNKCTLHIKIETSLKQYYMYSTSFIEITQSVQFVLTSVSLRSLVIGSAQDRSMIAKVRNVVYAG
jgi:hypothetical protein